MYFLKQYSTSLTKLLYAGVGVGATVGAHYLWHKSIELKKHSKDNSSNNLYLSFDIEADGPSPSVNSMVSIGIYGFDGTGNEVVSYQRNIVPPENRIVDIPTKERFWDKNPEALKFVQTNQVSAEKCMSEIAELYKKYKDDNYKIVWVARPSAFDWQWLNCYYNEFGPDDKPNIGFSASCISTAFWIYCRQNNLSKDEQKELWNELKGEEEVTHNPLDDARCQAKIMIELMNRFNITL
jgi:hypothetical protein